MSTPDARAGVWFALAAYGLWGLLPIYLKAVSAAPADEILVHRIVWSLVFTGALVALRGRLSATWRALRTGHTALALVASSLLIAVNWLIYIWGVNSGRILETALGYYINPLMNVVFGLLLFGERLGRLQWLAVLLAAIGIGQELIAFGTVPWIALVLATSFGLYGVVRKAVRIEAQAGLLLETAVLFVPAMLYWALLTDSPTADLSRNGWQLNTLLLLAGPVTAIPLICFAAAASRLQYSTLGMLQYLAPSLQFLVGVLLYGEQLTTQRLITFGFIWLALAVYALHLMRRPTNQA